ncbi:MAG: MATE family efflux transporter [Oscillospiraceae bacterium]|nr:MATE family efflux transporter [Oscillospiraceae bacterium]
MKEFAKYVSLNVLGMLGTSCYILADTYFIAQWIGADGIAALNLVLPVFSLINGLGLLFGIGGATKYTIYKNSGEDLQADRIFTHAIYLCIFISCFFVLAGIYYADRIVVLLGADEITFAMSRIYLKISLLFSPVFILNHILLCFVRNDGAPERPMTAMLAGSLSNIFLDYFFIFILNLGMTGAVLATCCSPIISMRVLTPFFREKKHHFHLIPAKPGFQDFKNIILLGGSSFISELSGGIVILVFNILILKIAGNTGVAAYAIITNVSLVVTSIWTGTAQGMQPLVSEAYAQKQSHIQYFRYACVTVIGLFFLIYGMIYLLADPIAGLFNKEQNAELQEYAIQGLRYYFSGAIFAGLNILTAMLLSATEQPVQSNHISLQRGLLIMIPTVWVLSQIYDMKGIWLTYPVTEILTFRYSLRFAKQAVNFPKKVHHI